MRNNICLEVATIHALQKKFPHLEIKTNDAEVQNDFQIDFENIANLAPGANLTSDALTKSKLEELKQFFNELDKTKVYISRKGQNLGAGHFTCIHFDKAASQWTEINGTVTGNLLDENYLQKRFLYQPERVGTGNHQYSLRLYELSLPRLFIAMNYVAAFRRQADEFACIGIAEQIENQLQDSDIFLTLSDNARTYWMGSDAIVFDEPEQLETSYIHYRFELLKNKVDRLDRYLNVICRKGLNTDDDLLSLITDCIIHMAPKSITEILNYKKQDFDFYRHAYQRLEDNLHRVQTPSDQANLSKPFQLFRIQNINNLNFNDELLQACAFNHPEAIREILIPFRVHLNLDFVQLSTLIDKLLETKKKHDSNWDTMIDSIKLISEQIFLLNNPEKSMSILKRLNAEGLNTNTPQGKELHDLAIRHAKNDSVNAENSTENTSCLYLLMMYIWNFIKAVFVFLHSVQPDEQRHPISNNR